MATTNSLSDADRYVAVHDSATFKALRRRSQTFIGCASAVFTGWWLLTIALAAVTPDVYRQTIVGEFNVGMLFVLATFALVIVISAMYLKFARTKLDPVAEQIRADLEGGPR